MPASTPIKSPTSDDKSNGAVPLAAMQAILQPSAPITSPQVRGYDFNQGINYDSLLQSFFYSGFQAQHFGKAVHEIERMLDWTLAKEPTAEDEEPQYKSSNAREKVRTKIFAAFTSNLVSSGLRETIRFLLQHEMVQVVCISAGGVEEDLIKCLGPTHMGEFSLDGKTLRTKGLNRIGNLIVPNENYCKFEDWFMPILNKMHDEQDGDGVVWTPSKMIHRFGKEINNEESICYWAYKNNIPIFCPALTDGSMGDMIYFHSYTRPGLIIDIVGDIRLINDEARLARKTGCIVVGGGVVKHHTMNANLMRNGADFCVYLSTAQEFDGCDSGAQPDEATSWGKIRVDATPVKIIADATLVLPLLVAQTFAKKFHHMGPDAWAKDREGVVFNKNYTDTEHAAERAKTNNSEALNM
eukprot:GEMP01030837.1.p1 GENE.GEMP01030837.1~~GEMP01030837.1.p1  ORF type:complete len:421 (-),score=67.51 GEMP01030837.1:939-2171(-)